MFNNDFSARYKKALVFGTGGGNDIVSAYLVSLYLENQGLEADVGGILSPAAVHTFSGKTEEVINELRGAVKRYLPSKNPVEISFFDAVLPEILSKTGAPERKFYDFSIRYGTSAFVEGLTNLVNKNNYDLVVGVDVGGDILSRGRDDSTILSPVMDFTSLYALGKLEVDTLLVEFGLGTDGELRSDAIKDVLKELYENNLLLDEGRIEDGDEEVQTFRMIFDEVAKIRRGHTATMTLRTLETTTPQEDIVTEYKSTSRVGKKTWSNIFPITLLHETFGRTYVIDAKHFAQKRKATAFSYANPLEQYLRLKAVPEWKTELDLHHLWSEKNWTTAEMDGGCLYLLIPSAKIPTGLRAEILKEGLDYINENADGALLLSDDLVSLQKDNLMQKNCGAFTVVGDERKKYFLEKTAEQVRHYLLYPEDR